MYNGTSVMNQKFREIVIAELDSNYHDDVDLLIKDIREEIELYKRRKQVKNYGRVNKDKNKIIEIKNVVKNYETSGGIVQVLKGVNLEVCEGEIVALVGPSGSGKSTLLNLIGGLEKPTSGEIYVNGKQLSLLNDSELSYFRNQTIGFIFQFFNLQPYLNVKDNVEIPLMFRGEPSQSRSSKSLKVIDDVGLSDRITHLPGQLSGGQMQRVAIARAIVTNPKILLADEPTGNLDRNTGIEIVNLIKEINRNFNTTVIIVTHDNFIANQADRIIHISNGKIV